jgi:large subunit ribosomal protein L15
MLETLKRQSRVKAGKRVGRGYGSGKGGHTTGRGTKGQKSRTGHKSTLFFEGGNVPFFRRLPRFRGVKRGRNGTLKIEARAINLVEIEKLFNAGDAVNMETLKEKKLYNKNDKAVKILGYGTLTKKLTFTKVTVSESAKAKIIAVGGTVA